MCEPTVLAVASLALGVYSGVQTSKAQKAAGEYQQQVADQNAAIGRNQAEQARQIGNIEEARVRRQARAAVASQRAALAANGLDINSGTALDLQAETAGFGEADALTARSNALRQAWGFEVGAVNDVNQGRAARAAGQNAATGTLLTTGANLAGGVYGGYQSGTFGGGSSSSGKTKTKTGFGG